MPPDPLILALDTSAAHCAAALLCGDKILAQRLEVMQKGQAERLFVLLEEILTEGNADWSSLGAIGVGIGPGNFTGIRIAVSSARGLAVSLGVPAIGVSTFEALAQGHDLPLRAIVDARRSMAYVQDFSQAGSSEPSLMPVTGIAALQPTIPLVAAGDTAELGPNAVPPRMPLAVAIGRVAAHKLIKGTAPRPAPLYIREADAAPPRDPAPTILP